MSAIRRLITTAACLLATALALAGCQTAGTGTPATTDTPDDGFVALHGERFAVAGRNFRLASPGGLCFYTDPDATRSDTRIGRLVRRAAGMDRLRVVAVLTDCAAAFAVTQNVALAPTTIGLVGVMTSDGRPVLAPAGVDDAELVEGVADRLARDGFGDDARDPDIRKRIEQAGRRIIEPLHIVDRTPTVAYFRQREAVRTDTGWRPETRTLAFTAVNGVLFVAALANSAGREADATATEAIQAIAASLARARTGI